MSPHKWTSEEIRNRLVRYPELKPCTTAFIDTRTPGSQEKENFTIIGPGVAENPDQYVHIDIPHGFNVGGARQPPGCVNSQHSHETAEVFIVHSGRWKVSLGENAEDGGIEIGPGDTISIPTHVFRGFTNVGEDAGFLFAVLGGDDPGNVTWAPYVFEAAESHGLLLLDDGRLVDTRNGEVIPGDAHPMAPTTDEDVRRLRRMTSDEIAQCVARENELVGSRPFSSTAGIAECPIIGGESISEGMAAGKMAWPHGFNLRRMRFERGTATPSYRREEPEVVLMHQGNLDFCWSEGTLPLRAGDVLTTPIGLSRSYRNSGDKAAIAYVVRGGDKLKGYLPPQ